MSIIINSDEDLRNISNYYNSIEPYKVFLDHILYDLPAYRCNIGIEKHNDDLIIGFRGFIESRNIKSFQVRWKSTVDVFVTIANEFGFIKKFQLPNYTGSYFKRPADFKIEDENALITRLLNTTKGNYMKDKYGLR